MTKTRLDDTLMATLSGGESFNGGLFEGLPPDRLQPNTGTVDTLRPTPLHPAHPQHGSTGQMIYVGPCPNPDANG